MSSEFYPPEDEFERAHWKVVKLGDAVYSLKHIFPKLAAKLEGKLEQARQDFEEIKALQESQRTARAANGKYKKVPIPAALRWQVFERDDYTCQNCGSRKDLTADHIFPEVRGGVATLENLQTLCKSCNSSKGAR
jgi:hypothetical protein